MRAFLFLICVVMALLIPAAVQAMIITDVTTNTVLFSDDFETVSPVSTIAAWDNSALYNPSPSVGSYIMNQDGNGALQVTNFNNGTVAGPGAIQGNNYLRVYRADTDHPNTATQELQAQLAQTPASGDLISCKFMAYFDSTGDNAAIFRLRDAGLDNYTKDRAGFRATSNYVVNDVNGQPTSLRYKVGQWQAWEIDYAIDSSTYSLTLDGVTVSGLSNLSRGGPGNVQGLCFYSGNGAPNTFYIDAMPAASPEPGTIVLLSTGLIGLVCYAWRKRK
jgi:hypothetical protein